MACIHPVYSVILEGMRSYILDHIHEAVLAHDMNRRIFIFNRAAERLTGLDRSDVLGRDCHDVFPGNFCGAKCRFCDGGIPWDGQEDVRQHLHISSGSGETRCIEMWITPLRKKNGALCGVIASLQDCTREQRLERELRREQNNFAGMIGATPAMQDIFRLIRDIADNPAPVLIQGASGTGKELVAAAIHNEGIRADKLFVPVNCGALPDTLLESELFGHVRGAFTGAVRDKKGRFELADGGTIFLDEIGDVSPSMQVKLLRVLQEGTFERVGSEKTIHVDVRVVSATNKNLREEIRLGRFREDLYFRLNVVPLHLPSLAERRADIPILAEAIIRKESLNRQRITPSIAPATMEILTMQDWPGNIRELQNWLLYALIKCKGNIIRPEHLPQDHRKDSPQPRPGLHRPQIPPTPTDPSLAAQVVDGKRGRPRILSESVLVETLANCGNNRQRAAEILGISRATLYRMLKKMRSDIARNQA